MTLPIGILVKLRHLLIFKELQLDLIDILYLNVLEITNNMKPIKLYKHMISNNVFGIREKIKSFRKPANVKHTKKRFKKNS